MIYLLYRIFTVILWIIVIYLYFSDPKKGIFLTLLPRMFLFNVRIGSRALLEDIPVFQIGTTSVLLLDGFFFALIFYSVFIFGKSILLTYNNSKIEIKPFALLFVWISIETVIGIVNYGESSIRAASTYLIPILFVFIIPRVFRDKNEIFSFLMKLFSVMVFSIIINFIYFYVLGGKGIAHLGGDWRAAYRFIGSHQAIIAGVTAIALIIFPSKTTYSKILYFTGTIISAGALIYTQFRTAWFSFVISLILLVINLIRMNIIQKKHFTWGMTLVSALFLAIAFSSVIFPHDFIETFQTSIGHLFSWDTFRADTTLSIRFDLWSRYWSLIKTRLIFGRGLGDYVVVINQANQSITTMMHNDLLAYLYYFGIIGFLLFLFPFTKWLSSMHKYLINKKSINSASLGLLLQIGVIMLFVFGIFFRFIEWFWLFIGLGFAYIETIKKEYLDRYLT